jgi:hypothetical protein
VAGTGRRFIDRQSTRVHYAARVSAAANGGRNPVRFISGNAELSRQIRIALRQGLALLSAAVPARQAIVEILRDTKTDLPRYFQDSTPL